MALTGSAVLTDAEKFILGILNAFGIGHPVAKIAPPPSGMNGAGGPVSTTAPPAPVSPHSPIPVPIDAPPFLGPIAHVAGVKPPPIIKPVSGPYVPTIPQLLPAAQQFMPNNTTPGNAAAAGTAGGSTAVYGSNTSGQQAAADNAQAGKVASSIPEVGGIYSVASSALGAVIGAVSAPPPYSNSELNYIAGNVNPLDPRSNQVLTNNDQFHAPGGVSGVATRFASVVSSISGGPPPTLSKDIEQNPNKAPNPIGLLSGNGGGNRTRAGGSNSFASTVGSCSEPI